MIKANKKGDIMISKTKIITAATVGVLAIGGLIGWNMCTARVGVAEIGIKYSLNGGLQSGTLDQGLHFKLPWEKVTTYPTSLNTAYLSADKHDGDKGDSSFTITSKDAKSLTASISYQYIFNEEMVVNTFNQFKGMSARDIEQEIRGMVKSAVNDVTNRYEATALMGGQREQINEDLKVRFNEVFGELGLIVKSVNLIEVEPDSATQAMVQQKIDEQQKIEIAKLEAERVAIENEKKLAEAQAEAEQKKVKAEAEAEATLIKARAESEANELLKQSISPELIEMEKISKWDGTLPQITGSSTPIVDLN